MNRFAIPLGIFALLVVVRAVGIKHLPEKGVVISPLLVFTWQTVHGEAMAE